MAGTKRKLSSTSSANPSSNGPTGHSQSVNGGRGRRRRRGRGSTGSNSHSSSSESPESHRSKRAKTSRGSSAERPVELMSSPRATRQSARLVSKGQAIETQPGHVNGDFPGTGSPSSPPHSQSPSCRSPGAEPAVPGNSFQGELLKTTSQEKDKVVGNIPSPAGIAVNEPVDSEKDDVEMSNAADSDQQVKQEDLEINTEFARSQSSSHSNEAVIGNLTPLPVPALTISGSAPVSQSETNSPLERDTPLSALSASPALTASDVGESSAPPSRRGGFRGGRKNARGRARGGRGGRQSAAGRLQPITPSLPPSPARLSKQLRERQKELERAYRKVAAAQKIALGVIASRSMTSLIKDPKAHTDTPLFDKVKSELDKKLKQRMAQIDSEHDFKIQMATNEKDCKEHALKTNYNLKIQEMRDEHFTAAQGSFMDFIQRHRQVEDDDHTEPEESDSEASALRRTFVRGFDSSYVRDPEGAALFDRAKFGWPEFLRRAEILDDISPQIRKLSGESGQDKTETTTDPKSDASGILQLVDAFVQVSDESARGTAQRDTATKQTSNDQQSALGVLADTALGTPFKPSSQATHGPPPSAPATEAPKDVNLPRYAERPPPTSYPPSARSQAAPPPVVVKRDIPRQLPHYPPPLPAFPPPPPPHTGPQPMLNPGATHGGTPRPLLPTPATPPVIPPLSEHRRLPDPFSSNAQVLPVPRGAAYLPPPHLSRQPPASPQPYPPYQAPLPPRFTQPPLAHYYPYGMYPPPPPHEYGYGYGPHPPPLPPHPQQGPYPPRHSSQQPPYPPQYPQQPPYPPQNSPPARHISYQ